MTPAVKYGQIIEYIPASSVGATLLHIASISFLMDYDSMVKWAASVSGGEEYELSASQQSQQQQQRPPAQPTRPFIVLTFTDRLYLASYTTPPTPDTLFPYPDRQPTRRSPSKRSTRAVDGPSAVVSERDRTPPHYFSIDDSLLYNAFHHDFGPLHIGHLYRFAVQFHDILGAPENVGKPVVFWSKADARSRANAACILASYMVLIQSWAPHLALAPIAQADPPLMPFRDAGYSQADYGITVQDVVYGVWRAKEQGFCALPSFDLEEYERYERVDQGDFNWITPDFLAFASPQHTPVAPILPSSPLYSTLPSTLEAVDAHPTLPNPFKNVLKHFSNRNIGLVVRLNSELYSPSYFTALGIEHLDMIFDDGTCPSLSVVRKFIKLAHEMITVKKRGIAVHCKAGLGRTGCLIGAYLIYRYGFTANEIIAYMRFMRPGMVVGPQQHWLHLNQGTFREWWVEEQFEEKMKAKLATMAPSTPTRQGQKPYLANNQIATPPNRRSPLGEVDNEQRNSIGIQEDCLPAPTPGQPRKTSRAVDRHHPYSRNVSTSYSTTEDEHTLQRETEMISIHRQSLDDPEGEDEWQVRMRTNRKPSRSPGRSEKSSRSISQTTTTIYTSTIDNDSRNDIENIGASPNRPKTPGTVKSGSGSSTLNKVRGSPKRSGDSLRNKEPSGVRKTSGRVGSVNASRKVSGL
ncbi:Tyrosine-protein phosphatase [Lachnellula hyalina]|uniref:protein-tyrosine-phosphatase n=1 Tax=Lachnellula hyalina TaxID=1316788 RepID=A0A8H8QZ79_9HELO|nr:Tyrosine-protein phosphatase [Lachnellula hyalina]TVY24875.1 Tyrosine-protein phosphatase [Lachnellula hyalina]